MKTRQSGEVTVEEEMSVIFHCTIGAVFIYVSGIPGCPIRSGECFSL
jgi:hypothetical protein